MFSRAPKFMDRGIMTQRAIRPCRVVPEDTTRSSEPAFTLPGIRGTASAFWTMSAQSLLRIRALGARHVQRPKEVLLREHEVAQSFESGNHANPSQPCETRNHGLKSLSNNCSKV